MPPRRGEVAKEEENGSVERLHGVKVVCLVSHPSSGSSELACAMGINSVIRIILDLRCRARASRASSSDFGHYIVGQDYTSLLAIDR